MNLRQMAAARAVELVQSDMIVGLGTGATAGFAIEMIGQRLRDGTLRNIVGIPTSSGTVRLATKAGIPLGTLGEHPSIDLTIDGADEVDPQLTLIKGQGGALLHEKIVARASRREVIVVDDSKLVRLLGTKAPLSVEVVPFGWPTYVEPIRRLGCEPVLRRAGDQPYVTDEGNYILDCRFQGIGDPEALECKLNLIPGVVENGLFIGLAGLVIVASESGLRELSPQ